jgi:ankyrin repeat protein
LEVRGQFGSTPLCHASIMGHYNVVQLLVDGGSNIEASNHHLETPVRHAILGDQINAVQLLYRHGAALTLEDKWGAMLFKSRCG